MAAFTTDSPEEDSSNLGLIIGIVVALVLLIAAAVIGYIKCKKKKKQIHVYDKHKEENANDRKFA